MPLQPIRIVKACHKKAEKVGKGQHTKRLYRNCKLRYVIAAWCKQPLPPPSRSSAVCPGFAQNRITGGKTMRSTAGVQNQSESNEYTWLFWLWIKLPIRGLLPCVFQLWKGAWSAAPLYGMLPPPTLLRHTSSAPAFLQNLEAENHPNQRERWIGNRTSQTPNWGELSWNEIKSHFLSCWSQGVFLWRPHLRWSPAEGKVTCI